MLRTLREWLAGEPADPTAAWPRVEVETPALDLFRGAVGPLPFGAPLADAQVLGRPDRLRWTRRGYCELLYRGAGLQVDFDNGHLAYAAFFLAAEPTSPPGARCCTARVATDLAFTGATTLADVEAALGEPRARDEDDRERILTYERRGLILEFEADARGGLKRVNVFPVPARAGA